MSKVHEVTVISMQTVAVVEDGSMDEEDIFNTAIDHAGIPSGTLDEATIKETAEEGSREYESILRHADRVSR